MLEKPGNLGVLDEDLPVTQVVWASTGVFIQGEDVVVDAILCAEHPFLEVRHMKMAARRLEDLGEDPRREDRLHR